MTVDPNLIKAGDQAVAAGPAASLSAWVNTALESRAAQDHRLRSLAGAVNNFENQCGEITAEEIAAHLRADREDDVVVRGRGAAHVRMAPKRLGAGAA